MIEYLKPENPAEVRRGIQSRYEAYMRGERHRIGILLPGIETAVGAHTPQGREYAYEQLVAIWPRKSRRLIHAVAREVVFDAICERNHARLSKILLENIEQATVGKEFNGLPAFISGLGRNSCRLTVLNAGQPITGTGSLEDLYAITLLNSQGERATQMPLQVDLDFGLGKITNRTPELYRHETGTAELASQSAEQFASLLEEIRATKV